VLLVVPARYAGARRACASRVSLLALVFRTPLTSHSRSPLMIANGFTVPGTRSFAIMEMPYLVGGNSHSSFLWLTAYASNAHVHDHEGSGTARSTGSFAIMGRPGRYADFGDLQEGRGAVNGKSSCARCEVRPSCITPFTAPIIVDGNPRERERYQM
jgi:hypothetical protein